MKKAVIFSGTKWSSSLCKCLYKLPDLNLNLIVIVSKKGKNSLNSLLNQTFLDFYFFNKSGLKKTAKKKYIDIPIKGAINIHPLYLPDYRESSPYFRVMRNFEENTGIIPYFIDKGGDTGDIIIQKIYQIPEGILISDLNRELSNTDASLLSNAIKKIINTYKITPIPQRKPTRTSSGLTAPKPEKKDLIINNLPESGSDIKAIYNFIKAIKPIKSIILVNEKSVFIKDILIFLIRRHNKYPYFKILSTIILFYGTKELLKLKVDSKTDKLKRYLINFFSRSDSGLYTS